MILLASLASLARLGLGHRLGHQSEGSLLGDVAERAEVLDRLLARGMLLTRNDATVVLHQVLLGETSWGVLGSSVKHLGFGSDGRNVGHGSTCRRDYLSFWDNFGLRARDVS